MELNAVAGRGEDPGTVLRSTLSTSRSTPQPPQYPPQRPRALRDHDGLSGGTTNRYNGSRESNTTAPRRRHPGGAGMPRSEKPASWARSHGFVSAGQAPAPGGGDGRVEAAAAEGAGRQHPWGERPSTAYDQEHARMAGSTGLGNRGLEHTAGARASTLRPPAGPSGGGSRGGSRWGVFASDRRSQGTTGSEGPGQQVRFCSHAPLFLPVRVGATRGDSNVRAARVERACIWCMHLFAFSYVQRRVNRLCFKSRHGCKGSVFSSQLAAIVRSCGLGHHTAVVSLLPRDAPS